MKPWHVLDDGDARHVGGHGAEECSDGLGAACGGADDDDLLGWDDDVGGVALFEDGVGRVFRLDDGYARGEGRS